jgi:succinyl-CoA synthetase beta subunit
VQQLQSALRQLTNGKGIKVVLVNILSSLAASEQVVEVIANFLLSHGEEKAVLSAAERTERSTGVLSRIRRDRSSGNGVRSLERSSASVTRLPHIVIRVVGGNLDSAKERLVAFPVHWIDNLDEAIVQAISLAQATDV